VLIKEGKILLLRRYSTGYEDGNYSFVAGHLDQGETFRQAMAREAKEEAGIIVDPKKLRVVHVMQRTRNADNGERIDVFMMADEWFGQVKNMEPERCDDLNWFSLNSLPENTIPFLRQVLDCIKNKVFYSEFGF